MFFCHSTSIGRSELFKRDKRCIPYEVDDHFEQNFLFYLNDKIVMWSFKQSQKYYLYVK